MKCVYIAAPYASDHPDGIATNVRRAVALGRLATEQGLAPIVVHPSILAGVYGDDNDPEARARGLKCTVAIAKLVARTSGHLWVLRNDDSTMSKGVAGEVVVWMRATGMGAQSEGLHSFTWERWVQLHPELEDYLS